MRGTLRKQITAERVRELFEYDPSTGVMTNKIVRPRTRVGEVSGCIDKKGYRVINADGVLYRAHRLAWLYHYGEWPGPCVDHINGVRDDNRIANLRNVSPRENSSNRTKTFSSTGALGVSRRTTRGKPFQAEIQVNGTKYHLGTFRTVEEAHRAYLSAKQELNAALEAA